MITVEKAYKIAKMVKDTCIKLDAGCNSKCPFANDPFCRMAVISDESIPSQWEFPSCKPQNDPSDAPKTDEGVIGRIEKLEREIRFLKDDVEFKGLRFNQFGKGLGEVQKDTEDLEDRVKSLEEWRKS